MGRGRFRGGKTKQCRNDQAWRSCSRLEKDMQRADFVKGRRRRSARERLARVAQAIADRARAGAGEPGVASTRDPGSTAAASGPRLTPPPPRRPETTPVRRSTRSRSRIGMAGCCGSRATIVVLLRAIEQVDDSGADVAGCSRSEAQRASDSTWRGQACSRTSSSWWCGTGVACSGTSIRSCGAFRAGRAAGCKALEKMADEVARGGLSQRGAALTMRAVVEG
jgi:hypothetical protein